MIEKLALPLPWRGSATDGGLRLSWTMKVGRILSMVLLLVLLASLMPASPAPGTTRRACPVWPRAAAAYACRASWNGQSWNSVNWNRVCWDSVNWN